MWEGNFLLPMPPNEGQVQISHVFITQHQLISTRFYRVSSTELHKQTIRLAPLSAASGEGQDQFSLVLQPVIRGAKSVHPSPLSLQ